MSRPSKRIYKTSREGGTWHRRLRGKTYSKSGSSSFTRLSWCVGSLCSRDICKQSASHRTVTVDTIPLIHKPITEDGSLREEKSKAERDVQIGKADVPGRC